MKMLYITGSYVVIAVLFLLGLRHIGSLNTTIELQQLEIDSMKASHTMVVEAYDQEIAELTKTVKERKVVVKEIVKTVAGTEDEKCLNRTIPDDVIDRLRKQNGNKK